MTIVLALTLGALSALLVIWLGYPLAMRVWSAIASQPIRPDADAGAQRRVTVVLATRECAEAIEARVANLVESDHPAERLRVVVALDAEGAKATPAELAALPAWATVVVGDAPGGKACALNAGVRAAAGDVLVMADTAQRFDRGTIPALVAHLEDARFGAVSGALHLAGHRRSPIHLYWQMERWLRYHESRVHSSIGVTGAVYAVRRDLWPVLPAGTLLDDVYVPMALILGGWRIGFVREARATEVRSFTASAESHRKARTLTGLFQLHSLLPDVLTARNPVRLRYGMHKLARLTTPLWVFVAAAGAVGAAVHLAARFPRASLGGSALALGLVLAVPAWRHGVGSGFSWALGMQLAVLRALRNGIARRWGVWHQSGDR